MLPEPQYFSLHPPACMQWPKEIHKQESAIYKKISVILNWPIQRQGDNALKTQLPSGL